MTTHRTLNYVVLIAATLLATTIHSYYVEYTVSAQERSFISLAPLPPLPGDRNEWTNERKAAAAGLRHFEYSRTAKAPIPGSQLEAELKLIDSTPLYLALQPSENITLEPIGRAKERAFWLGCILPMLLVLLPAFALLYQRVKRTEDQPNNEKPATQPAPKNAPSPKGFDSKAAPIQGPDLYSLENPAVITEKRDYVSHEYALARRYFDSRGLSYKLKEQSLLQLDGKAIDALVFATWVEPDPRETEVTLHFDITRGFQSLVG